MARLTVQVVIQTQAGNQLVTLGGQARAAASGVGALGQQIVTVEARLKSMARALIPAASLTGLAYLGRQIVDVKLQFDRLDNTLGVARGSLGGARQEMGFLRAESERLGLHVRTLGVEYGRFLVAALQSGASLSEAREVFSATSEAMTVLGASAEQQERALLALQQMYSKATIQTEELRRQLSEALPGAFGLMAKALGVTEAKLNKMLQQGQVLAKDALPKLAAVIRETYGDQLTEAVKKGQAELNRFKNSVDLAKKSLAEGFWGGFLTGVRQLTATLSAADFQRQMFEFGRSIGEGVRTAAAALASLARNLDLVVLAVKGIIAFKLYQWFMASAVGAKALAVGNLNVGASLAAVRAGYGNLVLLEAGFSKQAIANLGGLRTATLAWAGSWNVVGTAIIGILLLINEVIKKWGEVSVRMSEYYVKQGNLQGRAMKFAQEARKGPIELVNFEQAKTDLESLRREIEKVSRDREALRKRIEVDARIKAEDAEHRIGVPKPSFDTPQMKEYDNTLKTLRASYIQLTGAIAGATVKKEEEKKETNELSSGQLSQIDQIKDLIEKLRLAAEARRDLANAELIGNSAVREATESARQLEVARQATHDLDKLAPGLVQDYFDEVVRLVALEQSWARTEEQNRALREQREESLAAQVEGEASLREALEGRTDAVIRARAVQEALDKLRSMGMENDAEGLAILEREISSRERYKRSVETGIANIEREREFKNELRTAEAQLTDARTRGAESGRQMEVVIRAETEAIAAGVAIGSLQYEQILRRTQARSDELAITRQQVAAEEMRQGIGREQRQAFADLIDWRSQQAAARRYGSEVAGILQQYGLLSRASQELFVKEKALEQLRSEGLSATSSAGRLRLSQIEAELRAHQDLLSTLRSQQAQYALLARAVEPVRQAWAQVGTAGLDALADLAVGADVNFKDIAQSLLRTMIRAFLEMLVRWIAMQNVMRAEAIKTAAISRAAMAASMGGGGVTGGGGGVNAAFGLASLFGGGGGGAAAAGAGSSGGLVGGAAAGFLWVLPVAIGLYAVYKGFIEKSTRWAEMSTRGATAGNSGKILNSVRARVNELIKSVEDLAKELNIAYERIGDVTLGKRGKTYYVRDTEALTSVGRAFDSAEAAMEYARVRALQLAEYGDRVSQFVQSAIRRSGATTTQGLASDIEFARMLEARGAPEIFKDLTDLVSRFLDEMVRAKELFRTDLTQLPYAINQVGLGLVMGFEDMYDQLTGHTRSQEENNRRTADLFNAQKRLAIAKINLEIQMLKQQLFVEQIRARMVGGAATISSGIVTAAAGFNAGMEAFITTILKGAGALLIVPQTMSEALQEAIRSLEELRARLEAIPELRPEDIRGAGRGAQRETARQTARDRLEDLRADSLGEVARMQLDYNRAIREFRETAREGRLSAEELAEGIRLITEAHRRELRQRAEDLAGRSNSGVREIEEGADYFSGLRRAGRRETGMPDWLVDLLEGRFFARMAAGIRADALSMVGISDVFLEIDTRAQELRDRLAALAATGGIAGEELAAAAARIERVTDLAKQREFLDIWGGLLEPLRDLPEYAGQVKELKVAEVTLEYEIWRLKLEEAGLWERFRDLWERSRDAALAAANAIEEATRNLTGWFDAQLERQKQIADATKKAWDRWRDMLRALVDTVRDLTQGPLSALTGGQKYRQALEAYTMAKTRLTPKDVENLPGLARALLEAAQPYFLGGAGAGLAGGYGQLFQMVIDDLSRLALDNSLQERTVQAMITDEIAAINNQTVTISMELQGIRNTLLDILAAYQNSNIAGGPSRFLSSPTTNKSTGFASGFAYSPANTNQDTSASLDSRLAAMQAQLDTIASNTGRAADGIDTGNQTTKSTVNLAMAGGGTGRRKAAG